MIQTTKVLLRHARYRWKKQDARSNVKSLVKRTAKAAPLVAAVVAPLATLYDIPGLTQQWYSLNGVSTSDSAGSNVLSAVGLAFQLTANILLFLRYSKNPKLWRRAAAASTICFAVKTVLGVINLALHGSYTRDPEYAYLDAFFCTVFSTVLSGAIVVVLVFSAIVSLLNKDEEYEKANSNENRVLARHFLITESLFFVTLGIEALCLSRIEQTWTYYDALYFSLLCATTVGFGADFAPRKTASRVLLFPFAILTISGLAVMITTLLKFIETSPETRKDRMRAIYKERSIKESQDGKPSDELIAEVKFLEKANRQEKTLSRFYEMMLSFVVFIVFWFIGALIFLYIEPWTYGEALYFGYVSFLTIGLGDFYPSTPAGRVFFSFYAFLAIPISSSFFIQAFSNTINAINDKRLQKDMARKGLKPKVQTDTAIRTHHTHHEKGGQDSERKDGAEDEEEDEFRPFVSHAQLVERYHQSFSKKDKVLSARKLRDNIKEEDRDGEQEEHVCADEQGSSSEGEAEAPKEDVPNEDKTIAAQEEMDPIAKNTDEILAKGARAAIKGDQGNPDLTSDNNPELAKAMLDEVLLHALHLETISRKFIISKLPPDSQVRLVMQADKHIMARAIHSLERNGQSEDADDEIDDRLSGKKESDLEQMHMYRATFAQLLVAATRLKHLQGREQLIFERRRNGPVFRNGHAVAFDEERDA